ncbi:MAG TPA: YjbQ family protein [Acidimicrobiia bacterium]|jgi:secondary thiamine-phosphate synthase enzyme
MQTTELTFTTGKRPVTLDFTDEVVAFCRDKGDGLVSIFVPHATAGVAVFETGAGTEADLLGVIDALLPADSTRWRHDHGTPGHGRDHVLPAFISPSLTIPVVDGQPALGTWQSIVLVDSNVDNQTRKVRLAFLPG